MAAEQPAVCVKPDLCRGAPRRTVTRCSASSGATPGQRLA